MKILLKIALAFLLMAGGAQRAPATPEAPSLAEAGVRDIGVDIWYALLGPAGLLKQGLSPRTGTPAELAQLIETDLERWGRVVREARITAD